jgi:hypothetical protein
MSSDDPPALGHREIGGYFGLELGRHGGRLHAGARALNSGRNCLLYFLQARRPSRLYLPAYICDSMVQPLQQAGVALGFYNIDEGLEIVERPALGSGELLLYVNYFGLKNAYCRRLVADCGSALVLDNAQALFSPPLPCAASLYSPRKFIGVSDGGYLYTAVNLDSEPARDVSFDAVRHLAGRIDLDAAAFYQDFLQSEQRLVGRPLRRMSALTEAILQSVDYEHVRHMRDSNFHFLHAALGPSNALRIDAAEVIGPMVYPFVTDDPTLRQRLHAHRIYAATYWKEVLQRDASSAFERSLVSRLVPLPIDQRYGLGEMQSILDVVRQHPRSGPG